MHEYFVNKVFLYKMNHVKIILLVLIVVLRVLIDPKCIVPKAYVKVTMAVKDTQSARIFCERSVYY